MNSGARALARQTDRLQTGASPECLNEAITTTCTQDARARRRAGRPPSTLNGAS